MPEVVLEWRYRDYERRPFRKIVVDHQKRLSININPCPQGEGEKEKVMKLRNLTPHEIVVYSQDRTTVLFTVPSEGIFLRVPTDQKTIGEINGIPVQKVEYGEVKDLPAPEEDTVFIVSQMVLSALHGTRTDMVCPDTGKGAVRDENGRILGTTVFVVL